MMRALVFSLLSVPLALAGCAGDASFPVTLDAGAWHDQLLSTPGAFLLDVRTPEEYAQGHIANATLLPLAVLDGTNEALPDDRTTPVFVYCRSGSRSAQAADILADQGYTDVRNLGGGILSWQRAGYPVEA